jgi:hypothetical protein
MAPPVNRRGKSPARDARAASPKASAASLSATTNPAHDAAPTASDDSSTKGSKDGLFTLNPYQERFWLFHLFINEKFQWHRIGGLMYLLMYVSAWHSYLTDYDKFSRSPLVWALPTLGVVQSVSATFYFRRILPRQSDPGYYSDRTALSHDFVAENIFFSSILCFQCLYYADRFYAPIRAFVAASGADGPLAAFASLPLLGQARTGISLLVEAFFVFLPYFARSFFPITRFRDSLKNDKGKTSANYLFYFTLTWVTKIFYIWWVGAAAAAWDRGPWCKPKRWAAPSDISSVSPVRPSPCPYLPLLLAGPSGSSASG